MKASELIKNIKTLLEIHGQDVDVAIVYEHEGFFAFDLFPEVDLLEYPTCDCAPDEVERHSGTQVIAIMNREFVEKYPDEEEEEPQPSHLRIVKPEPDEPPTTP